MVQSPCNPSYLYPFAPILPTLHHGSYSEKNSFAPLPPPSRPIFPSPTPQNLRGSCGMLGMVVLYSNLRGWQPHVVSTDGFFRPLSCAWCCQVLFGKVVGEKLKNEFVV